MFWPSEFRSEQDRTECPVLQSEDCLSESEYRVVPPSPDAYPRTSAPVAFSTFDTSLPWARSTSSLVSVRSGARYTRL